jgi:hypothetical protein
MTHENTGDTRDTGATGKNPKISGHYFVTSVEGMEPHHQ